MKRRFKIITVGVSPAWDVTCKAAGLEWGQHKVIDGMSCLPAGKALNISRALAWMGEKSVAAGLWGRSDLVQMLDAMRPLRRLVNVRMTPAAGATRQNITIVDTAHNRDMHLRNKSELATGGSLRLLRRDLSSIADAGSVCIFAGAMPPGKLTTDMLAIVKSCQRAGARIAVDTSGPALRKIINSGNVWLVKPNVEELRELLGTAVRDEPARLATAARQLLDKVEIVLISRGGKGVIVVTGGGAWQANALEKSARVVSTVGCGDYLLAGFLKGIRNNADACNALSTAIKAATIRALGRWRNDSWSAVQRAIQVEIRRL